MCFSSRCFQRYEQHSYLNAKEGLFFQENRLKVRQNIDFVLKLFDLYVDKLNWAIVYNMPGIGPALNSIFDTRVPDAPCPTTK